MSGLEFPASAKSACADASVPWPQSATSTVGVNHLRLNRCVGELRREGDGEGGERGETL